MPAVCVAVWLLASAALANAFGTVTHVHKRGTGSCRDVCSVGGISATCAERISYSANHRFAGSTDACALATKFVNSQCIVCQRCDVKDTDCPGVPPAPAPSPGEPGSDPELSDTDKQLDFDCDTGLSTWVTSWNADKKAFCCANFGNGCADLDEPVPDDDDDDDLSNLDLRGPFVAKNDTAGISVNHRHHETVVPFNCLGPDHSWPKSQKAWCCGHHRRGCPSTVKFQCHDGLWNWGKDWSDLKKAWCCEHEALGCKQDQEHLLHRPVPTTTTTIMPFNCQEDLDESATSWSDMKKTWCCHNRNLGCFDCQADVVTMNTSWSAEKKSWCCKKEMLGCPIANSCDTPCLFMGTWATCRLRVNFAAVHHYKASILTDACNKSHHAVVHQCETTCGNCSLAETGCEKLKVHRTTVSLGPSTQSHVAQLPEMASTSPEILPAMAELHDDSPEGVAADFAQANSAHVHHESEERVPAVTELDHGGPEGVPTHSAQAHPAHVHHDAESEPTQASSLLPPLQYDCKHEIGKWGDMESTWSDEKKLWCCTHQHAGCTQDTEHEHDHGRVKQMSGDVKEEFDTSSITFLDSFHMQNAVGCVLALSLGGMIVSILYRSRSRTYLPLLPTSQ